MPYLISPAAADDLEAIWEYIARDSFDAADRFLEKFHREIQAIAKNPRIGHPREDLVLDRPLLFWPVGNYLIIYRAINGTVEFLAVVRSRDIPSLVQSRGL